MVNKQSWRNASLLRNPEPAVLAQRAGDRLLSLVAGLAPHDAVELSLVGSGDGQVHITVTILSEVADLEDVVAWVWADVAVLEHLTPSQRRTLRTHCAELVPAIRLAHPNMWAKLTADQACPQAPLDPRTEVWPAAYLNSGLELLRALSSVRAEVRVHLAPASDGAAQLVTHEARLSTLAKDPETFHGYVGEPVAARLFVGYEGQLSPRVRAALLDRGRARAAPGRPDDQRAPAGLVGGPAVPGCGGAARRRGAVF